MANDDQSGTLLEIRDLLREIVSIQRKAVANQEQSIAEQKQIANRQQDFVTTYRKMARWLLVPIIVLLMFTVIYSLFPIVALLHRH